MRIKWMSGLLAAAAWLASGPASAAIYLGLSVGQATFVGWPEYSTNGSVTTQVYFGCECRFTDSENADTAFRIVTGMDLTPNLMFEVSYSDFGVMTAETESDPQGPSSYRFKAEVSGLELALIPRMPVSDRLALFLKLGLLEWDINVGIQRDSGSGSAPGSSNGGRNPFAGFGAEFTATKNLAFRGDYTAYRMDDENLNAMMVSLIARFTGQRTRPNKRPAPRALQ